MGCADAALRLLARTMAITVEPRLVLPKALN